LIVVHTRMQEEATSIIMITWPVPEHPPSFKRFLRHQQAALIRDVRQASEIEEPQSRSLLRPSNGQDVLNWP